MAVKCTTAFLKAFRRCPDNPDIPLDTWRQHLWSLALPESHKHLSYDIYELWLNLRYRYLMLTSDIVALLQSLRQCYLLAVITNGPSNAQWEKVHRLHLENMFDLILVSGDLPWEKPNPNIYLAACNYLGVEPKNCVMIGDKIETDIQGGNDAKLGGTIWIPLNGDTTLLTNSTTKPDHIIQNVQDVLPILQQASTSATNKRSNSFRRKGNTASTSSASGMQAIVGCGLGSIRRVPYNRRIASLPDLDNGNSNSSDGS